MLSFVLKRIGAGIVVLVAVAFLTYVLLFFSSANIARNILGEFATEQAGGKRSRAGS